MAGFHHSLSSRIVLLALLAGVGATACGAPASRPARGPVADQVQASLESGARSFDHSRWGNLLAGGTDDGLVDYRFFQQRRNDLDAYLDRIAAVDLASLAPDHLKALLINAYNALTIRSILDHPSVTSIRDIDGVWSEARHRVGGFDLTLDEIEHQLLRPFFKDPRIHFAVNCASRSCAPLPPWSYEGDRLEQQLEERTRHFLSDPRNVEIEGGTLRLSKYFDWYGKDFMAAGWTPTAESVAVFVNRYARPDVAAFIQAADGNPPLAYAPYDWSLNAAVPPDPSVIPRRDAAASLPSGKIGWLTRLRSWITGLGPVGIAVYMVVYAVLTVLFIPASLLTIGAGAAYGVVLGTVVVSVGSVAGAGAAFLVARYLLRSRVQGWVAGNPRFELIDAAVGQQGWKIVALTRLSPAFPFNLQNYAYGLTSVGFWPYLFASWLAMLPGTLLYVYIGAVGAEVTEAASGAGHWLEQGLKGAGLVATLVVTVFITRLARKALKDTTQSAGPSRTTA